MISVLFVCTGNICRSPTAEGLLRKHAEDLGLDVRVDSAGITGYHIGEPPDRRSVKIAKERGIDLSQQKARQIRAEDFERFDYLLAMDHGHLRAMRQAAPPHHLEKIQLFLSFCDRVERDVPDPYYDDMNRFVEVFDLIDHGALSFLEYLRQEHTV